MLFNESFAATNEREGSKIARQIMTALLEKGIRIVGVTHLFELARGLYEMNAGNVSFLRAECARTYKLHEGEPLPTSFGDDLYQDILAERGQSEPNDMELGAAAS
jgi:dsDNA-specific endonuclease/ATPase MutS2